MVTSLTRNHDGNSLVTQVAPHALLEFSRRVKRENLDRATPITRELFMNLVKACDVPL
jgi:hypothetical protein